MISLFVKSLLTFGLAAASASAMDICGEDNRIRSNEPQIGRAYLSGEDSYICTITLIGKSCALTAGHCVKKLNRTSFNTRLYLDKYSVTHPRDIYEVDVKSTVKSTGMGNDFAVIRLDKNHQTGKYPGDVQGYFKVDLNYGPWNWETIQITGHGEEKTPYGMAFPQKQSEGRILKITGSTLHYEVDTAKGDSGAAILNGAGEIIGIHTHGGCGKRNGSNKGVLVSKVPRLKKAVEACLEWERGL